MWHSLLCTFFEGLYSIHMNSRAKLRGQALGLLSLLGIQFVLGMVLNLFVQLPKTHPGITGSYISRALHGFIWALTNGAGVILLLHVVVAVGLLLGSLTLVIRTLITKDRSWIRVSIIGALGVLAALTNGLAFLGYNNDVNSFVMALGFMVAATSYSTALAFPVQSAKATKRTPSKQASHFSRRFKPHLTS